MRISFESIEKSYKSALFKRKIKAVDGLSFDVPSATVCGLVGLNGAGKSSTIRMLMGLTRPDCGRVLIDNKMFETSSFLDDVGYLPENPYLYDHLSLRELLLFAGAAHGLNRSYVDKRSYDLLGRLGIEHTLNRPLKSFSKGMKQRAGLCFALLHDPSIVVLDEPMSGLDPLGRKMVCDLILDLKLQGKTVFFCSHILSDIERLCDKIDVLHQGRLVREFEADDIQMFRTGIRSLETEFVSAVNI